MTDIKEARHLFREAGLAFPTIPEELAARLKEQGKWLFSTREIKMWPYNLEEYIYEVDGTHVVDYVVLSHSGHGANSYALQYYLVHGTLEMFLHLAWAGLYSNVKKDAAAIRDCFSLTDEIVPAAQTAEKLQAGARLRIVGCHFYGSYWSAPGKKGPKGVPNRKDPAEVLTEALHWLKE